MKSSSLPSWWTQSFVDKLKITNGNPKSASVLYELEHGTLGEFSVVHQKDLFNSLFPTHRIIIVDSKGMLAGEAIYRIKERVAIIDHLEARPKKIGIGPALLRIVSEQSKKPIKLISKPDKIHFYKGCGLELAASRKQGKLNPDGGYVMSLPSTRQVARGGLLDSSWIPVRKNEERKLR